MVNIDKMPRAVDANYAVWTPDTQITLTNVPWDNNYRDIVKFSSASARNQYIDSLDSVSTDIVGSTYARADRPIRLNIGMTESYMYNYVRVYNPPLRNLTAGMYYYYFITGIEFISPSVTEFVLQLDVWNTFGDQVQWGNCYIERGHIGIANSKAFDNYGRDYLTLPEGLDTGSELVNVHASVNAIMDPASCWYMVTSNISLEEDPGNVKAPNLTAASPSFVQGAPSAAAVYVFKGRDAFVQAMGAYADYPWVIQGIMQVVAIPNMEEAGYDMEPVVLFRSSGTPVFRFNNTDRGKGRYLDARNNWRTDPAGPTSAIPDRYKGLLKFLTFPYMAIEITAYTGTPIVIKPEAWKSANASIAIKTNVLPGGQRIVIYPREYNKSPLLPGGSNPTGDFFTDGGDYLETATLIGNLPTFAVVNNAGILSLANQAHGLAQQYRATDWSQQKALQGISTSYDQSSAAIGNSAYQNELSRNTASTSVDIANGQAVSRAIVGAGSGAIGGAMAGAGGGGVGAGIGAATGIASGIAGVALDMQARNQQLGNSNRSSAYSNQADRGLSSYIRDTNKSLANFTARGDYEQSIAALNSKVQDTAMTPPFTSGQAGGDSFNFVHGGLHVDVKWKMVAPSEMRAIGEYWLRYGYAVRQFATLPQSLMVMTNFTYWKLSETYIKSARIPEGFKQAIRGILEKGVTVWNNPAKIGVTDRADNAPLSGVSL